LARTLQRNNNNRLNVPDVRLPLPLEDLATVSLRILTNIINKIKQGLHSLPTKVHKVLLQWNFLHHHSTCLVTLSVHLGVQSSCRVQTHYVDDFRLTTPDCWGLPPTLKFWWGVLIRIGQPPHIHDGFSNFGKKIWRIYEMYSIFGGWVGMSI